ncbi:hypothetical protein C8J55DRAFT_517537 [Lentinula edodes]|uniref:Uncharacterized protein n=1 Tax=Lentinula lateritia TaxID=40482 RepID=A0A9W9A719_9AGAR|nr:hypothetical protein C8J55DRAFT_517537 [Lentinula edodes]
MNTLDILLRNYSEPDECAYIVHFPGLGCTPRTAFHRTIPLPPFETLTAQIMFFQDVVPEKMPLSRMLRTLSRVISRLLQPRWSQDGQFSISNVSLLVLDLSAEHYPTHALFAFSPRDPSRMSMYLVHSIVLEMFCPALHASLPFSPTSCMTFTPTIRPRVIIVPAHPICIAYPEAFGILLPYFYERDTHFLVSQCLPLFKWIRTSQDPFVELEDESSRVSLGYFLAQMAPYMILIEHTVKTTMLARTAWQLIVLDDKLWRVLKCCYDILLNALAFTTTGQSLKDFLNEE